MLFLLKILVAPVLVAAMSLAARRLGPRVAGLLMGVPWMTGPVLFILGLERGTPWLVAAATGVLLAVVAISAFIVAFLHAARLGLWAVSVSAGTAAYALTGTSIAGLGLGLDIAAGCGTAALLAGYLAVPRRPPPSRIGTLPWWDIPVRMLATLALVTTIALSVEHLGPTLSGIAASFPVITTVVGSFTFKSWGRDAVSAMLRAQLLSLLAFVTFFWTVGTLAPGYGILAAHAAALLAGMLVSSLVLWLASRRA